MNTRNLVVIGLVSVFAGSSLVSQPPTAENASTSTNDPEHLGRVAKAWAYPQDNNLSITPGIGELFPLHVVISQTDDAFDDVCRYYANKCGHKSFDEIDLRATGKSRNGFYLIRDHRADTRAEIPRMIFMHDTKNHTVSVTVMRPINASQTQVDVCVSVR